MALEKQILPTSFPPRVAIRSVHCKLALKHSWLDHMPDAQRSSLRARLSHQISSLSSSFSYPHNTPFDLRNAAAEWGSSWKHIDDGNWLQISLLRLCACSEATLVAEFYGCFIFQENDFLTNCFSVVLGVLRACSGIILGVGQSGVILGVDQRTICSARDQIETKPPCKV